MARQYNFALGLDAKPALGRGFALLDAGAAAGSLGRNEAKIVRSRIGRTRAFMESFVHVSIW